jgi:hypothetical protein
VKEVEGVLSTTSIAPASDDGLPYRSAGKSISPYFMDDLNAEFACSRRGLVTREWPRGHSRVKP